MNFLNDISNRAFQKSDIVKIQAASPDKVIITNFPDLNTPRYVLTKKEITFKITQNKLEIIMLPNEILITKTDNNEVAKISFDVTNNKLIVTSTGEQIANADKRAMILLYLRDGSTGNIKYNSLIASNQNASKFVTDLNNKDFALNDIIQLQAYTMGTANITNFPTQGSTHVIDTSASKRNFAEYFKITSTKLEQTTPTNTSLPFLPQTIGFKYSGSVAVELHFNTLNKTINAIGSTLGFSVSTLKLKLTKKDGTLIFEKTLATSLAIITDDINNLFFDYGQILQINYIGQAKQNVVITNFPNPGVEHVPTNDVEYYEITQNGLVSYTPPAKILPNEILITKPDNTEISKISFDVTNNKLIVTSTGEQIANADKRAMIILYLRDGSTKAIKDNSFIISNQDASKFVTDLNNKDFVLNDIIELQVYTVGTAKVTSLPSLGNTYTIDTTTDKVKTSKEFFKITSTALQTIPDGIFPDPSQLPQSITYRLSSGTSIFSIYFNSLNKTLIGKRTPSPFEANYFKMKLSDINGTTIFEKARETTIDTTNFIYSIANLMFNYDEILQLNYSDSSRGDITISNFPTTGDTHKPSSNEELYKITQTGLEKYTPPLTTLPNEIVIKKTDGSTFGTIAFNLKNKQIVLTDFNDEYSSGVDDYSVLNFRLYAANDRRTKDLTLNSIANANTFLTNLNNASFDINSVLELAYDDRSKASINITNFPNPSDIHTPTVVREYYKITDQGLESHIPIPDTIKYLKSDNSPSYIINLDLIKKVASCSIVSRNKNTDNSAFVLKTNKNISAEILINSDFIIYPREKGKFDYANSQIECTFAGANYKVVFVNYPTIGATYTLPNDLSDVVQRITINGIKR